MEQQCSAPHNDSTTGVENMGATGTEHDRQRLEDYTLTARKVFEPRIDVGIQTLLGSASHSLLVRFLRFLQ